MKTPIVIGIEGDAALAWGVAASLRRAGKPPPILIPLNGGAPATSRAGIECLKPRFTPLAALNRALERSDRVLVWGADSALPDSYLDAQVTVIGEQFVIRRERVLPMRLRRRPDRRAVQQFLRTGNPECLVETWSPLGRDTARLARALRGARFGLALGGGGAWGFAHVALIQSLEEAGIPIDLLSGCSMGACVAGIYAAGGADALDRLVARRRWLLPAMGASGFHASTMRRFMDTIIGPVALRDVETPFLPVTADLQTSREVILREGTVSESILASSRLPPMWPAVRRAEGWLADGAILNIVPASAARREGADFVLAGNAIPNNPKVGNDRVSQALRAACMLMWRSGRDRSLHADLTVDLGDPAVSMTDFSEAPMIIDRARERLTPWIPEILAAWKALDEPLVSGAIEESEELDKTLDKTLDNVIPLRRAA